MSKLKKKIVDLAVMSCICDSRYSFNDLSFDSGSAFYNSKGKRTKPQKKSKNRRKR